MAVFNGFEQRVTTLDPSSENYYSLSPYVYVCNNPMRIIDLDGKDWFVNNENGNLPYLNRIEDLSKLNQDQLDKYKMGDASQYKRLGAFWTRVQFLIDTNVVKYYL